MQLVTFTFGNNLDSRTISVKGSTMRNAMHWAARKLGVKECNLIYLGVSDSMPKAA